MVIKPSPDNGYKTITKFLHNETVSQSISSLTSDRVFQTPFPHTATEEVNLPRNYRTSRSQLRFYFCSSFHSYRERIGLIPSCLCPSWGRRREPPHTLRPHFILSLASHIPDWKKTYWNVLAYHSFLAFLFYLLLLPHSPPQLPSSNRHESQRHSSSLGIFSFPNKFFLFLTRFLLPI